jgi:hypothetical protein
MHPVWCGKYFEMFKARTTKEKLERAIVLLCAHGGRAEYTATNKEKPEEIGGYVSLPIFHSEIRVSFGFADDVAVFDIIEKPFFVWAGEIEYRILAALE